MKIIFNKSFVSICNHFGFQIVMVFNLLFVQVYHLNGGFKLFILLTFFQCQNFDHQE